MNLGNVFILGDSYSTFKGYIPSTNASYYQENGENTDVHKVNETWWHQLIAETNSNLVLNDSWSGTTICNTGYNGNDCSDKSFIARFEKSENDGFFTNNKIDTILIFGGTNDTWACSPLGERKYSNWTKIDLFCVLPATCYLVSHIKNTLPNTRILFIINTQLKPEIENGIIDACDKYGVEYISLKNISKQNGHPDKEGMTQIKEQVLKHFLNKGDS